MPKQTAAHIATAVKASDIRSVSRLRAICRNHWLRHHGPCAAWIVSHDEFVSVAVHGSDRLAAAIQANISDLGMGEQGASV